MFHFQVCGVRFGHAPPPAGVTDIIRGALDGASASGQAYIRLLLVVATLFIILCLILSLPQAVQF